MGVRLHWFLPTGGDGRDVTGFGAGASRRREPTRSYLAQVARAADDLGFDGVLTPTGTWCEDAWLTCAALVPETTRLKFLVAFRPGLVTPTLAAQMAATFQRLSGGRCLLNVVTGGEGAEQRRFGDHLDHDERYDRTDEFLEVVRGAWNGPFTFSGRHYVVEDADVMARPTPEPAIYLGGASEAAEIVAARHADVHLSWAEPPGVVAERITRVAARAAALGRRLGAGIRLHVISRDTSEQAWAVADGLLAAMDPEVVARAQARIAGTESEGQRRMAALNGGRLDDLEVSPNLWAGYGLVRDGAGTALVGSHDEVTDRIAEYHAIGVDDLILSGQPHVEEAYWFGENVIPRLADRGLLASTPGRPSSTATPAGPS